MRIGHLIFYVLLVFGFLIPYSLFASTGTIDPSNRTSWLCTAEAGNSDCHDHTLVNWRVDPGQSSATPVSVADDGLSGWIFSSELGWIHLAPSSGASTTWTGVHNDGSGNLSGYGWGMSASWVNFNPTSATSAPFDAHGVEISTSTGEFSGWAWLENYGWMLFDCGQGACVKTDWSSSATTTSTTTTIIHTGGGTPINDPIANPVSGTYLSAISVKITATSSTFIKYTLDPNATLTCSNGTTYTSPIDVLTSETIKAIGCDSSGNSSDVVVFVYTIEPQVGDPTSDHSSGTYSSGFSTILSSLNSSSIRYTNDGSNPSCSYGTVYSTPINIAYSENIKAIGCASHNRHSSVVTFQYVINTEQTTSTTTTIIIGDGTSLTIHPPQASLTPGTYTSHQSVTLSSTNAASIRYTIDGSTPTCSSGILYVRAIEFSDSVTIKAIGCGTDGNFSLVSTFDYVIASVVEKQVIDIVDETRKIVSDTFKKTRSLTVKVITAPKNISKIQIVTTVGLVTETLFSIIYGIFLSAISFADILLIPIRLWSLFLGALGLSKRKKPWGTVYDSVTKQPLDPAYIVLRSLEGKDVATAITDLDGRYGFVVPSPGNYALFAHKTNYSFPSQKLVGQDHDELYRDLYFGEFFAINKSGEFVAKNIPMDPEKFDWNEFAKKSQHLMKFYSNRDKWLSRISAFFFWMGFIFSSLIVLAVISKVNVIIFLLYVVLFFIRTFGLRTRPFGTITSEETGQPISFAVIRISQQSTGVEVMHRVADSIGKYYCLLPNGKYFVRVDQKLSDGTYKKLIEKMPVTVSRGYLSEKISVSEKGTANTGPVL